MRKAEDPRTRDAADRDGDRRAAPSAPSPADSTNVKPSAFATRDDDIPPVHVLEAARDFERIAFGLAENSAKHPDNCLAFGLLVRTAAEAGKDKVTPKLMAIAMRACAMAKQV
jgi:hypothetical protein